MIGKVVGLLLMSGFVAASIPANIVSFANPDNQESNAGPGLSITDTSGQVKSAPTSDRVQTLTANSEDSALDLLESGSFTIWLGEEVAPIES